MQAGTEPSIGQTSPTLRWSSVRRNPANVPNAAKSNNNPCIIFIAQFIHSSPKYNCQKNTYSSFHIYAYFSNEAIINLNRVSLGVVIMVQIYSCRYQVSIYCPVAKNCCAHDSEVGLMYPVYYSFLVTQ